MINIITGVLLVLSVVSSSVLAWVPQTRQTSSSTRRRNLRSNNLRKE